ncbi:MAG: hypothetical protein IPH98_17410 [Saprospiraceae bacterium]|nr:hypothetical protein [Candidatus Defluviibacterium haderslevense]
MINNSDLGFNYFLVDWQDGSPLDSMANYQPFVHIYRINDSDLCNGQSSKNFLFVSKV